MLKPQEVGDRNSGSKPGTQVCWDWGLEMIDNACRRWLGCMGGSGMRMTNYYYHALEKEENRTELVVK